MSVRDYIDIPEISEYLKENNMVIYSGRNDVDDFFISTYIQERRDDEAGYRYVYTWDIYQRPLKAIVSHNM